MKPRGVRRRCMRTVQHVCGALTRIARVRSCVCGVCVFARGVRCTRVCCARHLRAHVRVCAKRRVLASR